MPEDRDSDVTLGEVNRNVNRVELSVKEALAGLVTKTEFNSLVERVKELEASGRSRFGNWVSVLGIIIPSVIAVYALLKGNS